MELSFLVLEALSVRLRALRLLPQKPHVCMYVCMGI